MRDGILLAVLAAVGVLACCQQREHERVIAASFGDLAVYDAYAPSSPVNDVTSVYFTVANRGPEPDVLEAVRIAVGTARLHEVVIENDLTRMRPVHSLPVPAQGELRLSPGGYHVMLSQMGAAASVGDTILVELEFSRAGSHTIPVAVLTYTEVLRRLGAAQHDGR